MSKRTTTKDAFSLTADNKIFIAQLPLDNKHWIVFGKTREDNEIKTREFKTYREALAYAHSEQCNADYVLKSKLEFI